MSSDSAPFDETLPIFSSRELSQNASERQLVQIILKERLLYHRSLFRSTQLRLFSLDKRIQNASTLAFNMVTQQDSLIMIHDSASVAILTTVAAVFVPITSIANIIGSQLFVSNQGPRSFSPPSPPPLSQYLYIIGIPVTVAVLGISCPWYIWRCSRL